MHFLRTLTQSSSTSTTHSSASSITDSAYSSVDNLSLSAKSERSASTSPSESLRWGIKFFSDAETDSILRQSVLASQARKEETKEAKKLEKSRLKERLEILEEERQMEVSLSIST